LTDGSVRVRMGLHTAEPYLDDEGYVGVGVHRAARICAAGHGGQVLLSNATAGIVEDLGLEGVQLHDLGDHRLKDMRALQRLFQLDIDGLVSEFPPLKSLDTADSITTLLAVDLADWSLAIREFGDERMTVAARKFHRFVVDDIRRNGGRELELIADNALAAFDRPLDALRAAKALREVLLSEPWFPGDEPLPAAMGIHSGRVTDMASRHLGTTGFRCIALCQSAEAGQILVSHATEALLAGEVTELELRDLGEREIKRFDRPAHVFELL
jgi:class 3 adenylate cyclase